MWYFYELIKKMIIISILLINERLESYQLLIFLSVNATSWSILIHFEPIIIDHNYYQHFEYQNQKKTKEPTLHRSNL